MSLSLPRAARPAARLVPAAVLAAALFQPAQAAAPAADFAVPAPQLQALGVQLLKLDRPGAIAGLAYPARVIVPPAREQVVSAPVGGVVDQLLVSGQENVRSGQPLVRLASPEFGDLQLRLMEASGKARLSQQALAREQALFAEGIIPERRVQEARTTAQADDARRRQAEAELRLAGADGALLQRLAAGGPPDEGLLVRARAPGQVQAVEARPGQRVHPADPLLRVADLRELWLDVTVPADRGPLPAGEITVVGRAAAAVAMSLGAVASDSQTVTLRARVVRGAAQLRAGEVVQAQVPFPKASGWALPLQAVTYHEGRAWVFVRSEKGFTATPVNVVSSAGDAAQVDGPLRAGQEVATRGIIALKAAWLGKSGGN